MTFKHEFMDPNGHKFDVILPFNKKIYKIMFKLCI